VNFSAFVPTLYAEQANAALRAQGFIPFSFFVPLQSVGATRADYAGTHMSPSPRYLDAIRALDPAWGVIVEEGTGENNFVATSELHDLTWIQATGAGDPNVKMKGDTVVYDGKTWVSLIDCNVWEPPVGWREVVTEGYPAWVQPTGAHDAYRLNDKVTHNGFDWNNTGSDANVWEPGVFGWTVIV
jgi:hypothetical protein